MGTKKTATKTLFGVQNFDLYGKRQWLRTPGEGEWLMVDWDDVAHHEVASNLRKMCVILNTHWNDPAYAGFAPKSPPEEDDFADYDDYEKAYEAFNDEADAIMRSLES